MSSSPQSTQPAKGYGVIKLPGVLLRNCQVCTSAGKKSRSHHICAYCEKGVHPKNMPNHKCYLNSSSEAFVNTSTYNMHKVKSRINVAYCTPEIWI